MPVKATRLMVADWTIGEHLGLTFRAAMVEPLPAVDAETGRQVQQWCATGLNR